MTTDRKKQIRVSEATHRRLKEVAYELDKGRNSDEPRVTLDEAIEDLLWWHDEGKRP